MNGYLMVGDIVVVSTVLFGIKEYPVLKVERNRAFTTFRDFNTKIHDGGKVFEFGWDSTTNVYWIKDSST